MWLLVMMAGFADAPPISRTWLRLVLLAGPAVFLAVGFAGDSSSAGAFLAYPEDYAKALIMAIEVAMIVSIAVMLGMLVAGHAGAERSAMTAATLLDLRAPRSSASGFTA